MDREEVLDLITEEDVVEILKELGSHDYRRDGQSNIYFLNICHGDTNKKKLHYFHDSKMFRCYTCCGTLSLYDVVSSALNIEFKDAFRYVCNFKGIQMGKTYKKGLQKRKNENTDRGFLKLHLFKKQKQIINIPSYDKSILNIFDDYIPESWCEEGISESVAKEFNIGMYFPQFKATIPHFDINGNLVGVRSRNFEKNNVDNGRKYMPITIQNLTYRYPMNFNLYGIYQNKEAISKYKKAIIFESEKSVLLYGSIYGQENNIAVATSGMTFSSYQRDLLLLLGVQEIVIAYDKQYKVELLDNKENKKERTQYIEYIKRLIKISKMVGNYCITSAMLCWDERIVYKSAPIDHGREIFEQLYRERYVINNTDELKKLIE